MVVLTTYGPGAAGARGASSRGLPEFLLKHAPPEELLLGVRAAADGGALLSPAVTKRLLAEFAARGPAAAAPAALAGLTSREREVLDLVVRGRSNAEIAAQLVVAVAERQVKTHVGHILDKLGLHNQVHAGGRRFSTGWSSRAAASPGSRWPRSAARSDTIRVTAASPEARLSWPSR